MRQFFKERFPRLPPEAITPVTNLIDRLRAAPTTAALLGNPLATYDIRAAMDRGQIVLVCPGSGSGRDRLIANFVVFDALHGARSRADVPPEQRSEFYIWLDEVQIYDGASSGTLAALLEQVAKFGVRALLLNQNPERLSAATRDAVTTNRSHLVTTALNSKGAGLLARELGGEVERRDDRPAPALSQPRLRHPRRRDQPPVPARGRAGRGAVPRRVPSRRLAGARRRDRPQPRPRSGRPGVGPPRPPPQEIVKHLAAQGRRPGRASGGRQSLDAGAAS